MIRCLLVDDEPWALELLASYLQKVPGLTLVAACDLPLEALRFATPEHTDLIFLDIQMPELDGLQFMQAIDHQCKVVITSAYTEYAIHGYEHNVVDYLVKPIAFERFYKAVQKASSLLAPATTAAVAPTPPLPHIFIKTDNKLVKVRYDEILYLEGARDYVLIHTTKDKLITLDSLRNLEELLPKHLFTRIHKSYVVAIDKVDAVEKNRIVIGADYLPIGERHRAAFMASLNRNN
ncbi:LytTR family DNA-binding domain-containing protein [Chitinophaga pendula]|uniref:LytR/AlgR family response regulator transcription factor n=1 Tax=Chitinophaga TaxID=79328 RepID=UPI000BAFE20E|nr:MULTISPECIES: LytTR family DNA-binding domain-containing protein [Chitinophaga]ASZ12621.1 DNA-binding response regulator [Chitinophaga sp. MD30]UCJ09771.1 LytTR family DNA-binding domain-containing protein [Chitinophaga pendula]